VIKGGKKIKEKIDFILKKEKLVANILGDKLPVNKVRGDITIVKK